MPDQPPRPRRRGVDTIALTLCALGIFLAYSLFVRTGADRFVLSDRRGLRAIVEQTRYRLFDSLGLAAYGFVAAWFFVAGMRIFRTGPLRMARRSLGLALLILGSAVLLDRLELPLSGPLSGRGGAIGAGGSLRLGRALPPLPATIILVLGLIVGLQLAADPFVRLVRRCAAAAVRIVFAMLGWVLRIVSAILEATANCIRRVARPFGGPPPRRPTVSSAAGIPIHHHLEVDDESPSRDDTKRSLIAPFPRSAPSISRLDPAVIPERPYDLPPLELLDEPTPMVVENLDQQLCDVASRLEKACGDFGLTVKVVGIHTGPVITQYEISLDTGLRVSKITSLSDDLALHLRVPSVRIIAPIPGKNAVGIEVPNERRDTVRMKELAVAGHAKIAKSKLPLLLGKDSEGRPLVHDLADMPHLLIAGRTGTGKSVCLNSIILSLLLTRRPDECKLIMIDPKQVELAEYGQLPHLMHPVVTDNKKAEAILAWAVDKMEERYEILRRSRVRNIGGYNELPYDEILRRVKPVDDDEQQRVPPRMPYIVIVVDEVGDLMMAMKKEVEGHIIRLAQKSRAAGIHLILTTQRPTVDVITGLIKSNLPARICFQVADRSNSRVVLDEMGAEKLLGRGDMLFLQPNTSTIVRAQGTYASDEEIQRIVGKLQVENPVYDSELLGLKTQEPAGKGGMMEAIRKRDELYEEAIAIVVREGRGSVSLLQRALGIGYGRAARLIDFMAEDGIVGHYNGAQAREVLFTVEQWDEMRGGGASALAESA